MMNASVAKSSGPLGLMAAAGETSSAVRSSAVGEDGATNSYAS